MTINIAAPGSDLRSYPSCYATAVTILPAAVDRRKDDVWPAVMPGHEEEAN